MALYPLFFKIVLSMIIHFVEFLYLPVTITRFFKNSTGRCPKITNDVLLLPACTLASRIRKKEISCEFIVKAYTSRIEEINSSINAVMEERFQEAVEEAQKTDQFLTTCSLSEEELKQNYPLLGVPLTIKGSIAVTGMNHSGGRIDRNVKSSTDAIAVQRAKAAGAIPLLTSNTPEMCLNWETKNKLIGTTRNPYNTARTVGGSSGGETSLLTSGASLIGIGSDIAGSLRLPAHYCGVWGHKPSPLVVSPVGHYPDCKQRDEWNNVFTLGPLARYAKDLRLLLRIIAEPSMDDVLKLSQMEDVKKIRIYYLFDTKSHLTSRTSNNVKSAIQKVVSYFENVYGIECIQLEHPLVIYWAELSYVRLLNVDDIDYVVEKKSDVWWEFLKFLGCSSKYEITTICYGLLRQLLKLLFRKKTMTKFYDKLEILRSDLIRLLGDDAVLICPSFPSEAKYHGDVFKNLFNFGYLSIFNALGFPVTNCPIELTKDRLPIGIQVAAAPNCDRLSLSIAEELESAFGGWNPPCDIPDNLE